MAPIGIALRRVLLILLVAVGVAAAVSWRRGQSTPTPAEPPQWPPLPQRPDAPEPATSPTTAQTAPTATAPEKTAPETTAPETTWLPPLGDGSAPASHPIKVKVSSGIFHVPGGRFYERTRADRCYPTAAAAEADGYRRSKT